jgi:hypothetical protein
MSNVVLKPKLSCPAGGFGRRNNSLIPSRSGALRDNEMKRMFAVLAIVLIAVASVAAFFALYNVPNIPEEYKTFVGVTYCGNSVEGGKLLIDKVKGYTNLFVLQSGTLQRNLNSVEQLGDYAVSKGLCFLPYFGSYIPPSFSLWLENATQRWETRFLGVYYDDEIGGKMLDDYVELGKDAATGDSIMKTRYGDIVVQKPNGVVIHYEISGIIHLYEPANSSNSMIINRTETADVYATFYPNGTVNVAKSDASIATSDQISNWSSTTTYEDLMNLRPLKDANEITERFYANNRNKTQYLSNLTRVFTSDYALYWFDYLAGYDVVLAQIGWNISFPQQIALVRGAAKLQNRDWGAVITWKYDTPPYLDNGSEILKQMTTAHECGAKYIILFNHYEGDDNPYGTMQDEHFLALQDFWSKVMKNPDEIQGSIKAETALILPKNYGCGLRWKEDKIWGVLEPDEKSLQIWNLLQSTLANNGFHLDIVYDDSEFPITGKYQQIVNWNQTG